MDWMATKQRHRPFNVRQRVFIEHYVQNGGNGTAAAKAAGYSLKNARVSAHRLLRSESVANEINKQIKVKVRNLAPRAVSTVEEVMGDKQHKDRLRAARTILERSDPAPRTDVQNTVNVLVQQQQPSGDELALKVMRLAKEVGWSDEMLRSALGHNTNFLQLEQQLRDEPVVDEIAEPAIIDVQAEAVADVVDEPEPEDEDGDEDRG
jgi:phage terminase small subunit